jgi:predicted transcriptional regulator
MATAKQDVRRVLDGLPEEASLEDIQYHLYVLQRIERGREDVEAGRVLPQDEVEQRVGPVARQVDILGLIHGARDLASLWGKEGRSGP